MSSPRPSLCWLGAVAALGLGTACSEDSCEGQTFDPPPEPEPSPSTPTLIAGEWIGAGVLELSFTMPLSSVGDLDPERFAIIGWDATAYSGGSCVLLTNYRELSFGYYYNATPSVAAAWIAPEDSSLLRVQLGNAGTRCQIATNSMASGVLLAYTDATHDSLGAKLLDQGGDPIGDFGPGWAIQQMEGCLDSDYYYCGRVSDFATGHLPLLPSLVPIPCPS